MAIHEQHREDLLKEATAFSRRLLLACELPPATPMSPREKAFPHVLPQPVQQQVFLGLRKSGGWSVYVNQDPVLQFTRQDTLRRLFWGGERYAARNGHLLWLARETAGGKVQFREGFLVSADESKLISACQSVLHAIAEQWRSGRCQVIGQVPAAESHLPYETIPDEMLRLLCRVEHGFRVADSLDS